MQTPSQLFKSIFPSYKLVEADSDTLRILLVKVSGYLEALTALKAIPAVEPLLNHKDQEVISQLTQVLFSQHIKLLEAQESVERLKASVEGLNKKYNERGNILIDAWNSLAQVLTEDAVKKSSLEHVSEAAKKFESVLTKDLK